MARNSRRVDGLSRNAPSMRLVTITAPGLWTPRVVMHWCAASITTATPSGFRTSSITLAIWAVIFSWICNRRPKASTRRASLLMPTIRRRGR